jgi:hypothetical protein
VASWSAGKTVVVLGAGATWGAKFVGGEDPPMCLPPLNADFFTQLQRIATPRHQSTISAVLKDVLELYGPDFDLTLERYFTQLEAMLLVVRALGTATGKFGLSELQAMRTRLLDALSAVLEESADVAKTGSRARKHPCAYHAALVEALKPKDTIISFNYDCVIDHALRTSGDGKWSARYGYGFPHPARVEGTAAWDASNAPTAQNRSINLLKLHGSLNWFRFPSAETDPIRLRERPYKQKGQKLYEIVPPEYAKTAGTRPVFLTLQARASLAIRKSKTLAFIGFSFTPTDLEVEALFRLASAENTTINRVIIVNPESEHRKRIRTIIAPALENGARLVQFDGLAEAAPHLHELLS